MNKRLTDASGEVRELEDADVRHMRRMDEVLPGDLQQAIRKRGERGPQKAPTKVRTTIRLSPEVVEHFKASGEGWQGRIDQALKEYIEKKRA